MECQEFNVLLRIPSRLTMMNLQMIQSYCIYLYSEIHVLLLYLHDELKRIQDILTRNLGTMSVELDSENHSFPYASLAHSRVQVCVHSPHCDTGRPNLSLDMDVVVFLRSMHFNWVDIAQMLGVSRSTLYRRCKAFGIYDLENEKCLSYTDVLPVIQQIKADVG